MAIDNYSSFAMVPLSLNLSPPPMDYIFECHSFFFFFFVECEFQPMASAHDNSFLLSDQDTKSVLV